MRNHLPDLYSTVLLFLAGANVKYGLCLLANFSTSGRYTSSGTGWLRLSVKCLLTRSFLGGYDDRGVVLG
uniref:Uncharacterized protein n=1 Tax=Siphoviridae sp. ctF7F8 TaxID=2826211 RepID=A0A8S5MKG7_9CAUD|nr:MAG TPA: hypothetical protein [Siphoviridae sp. ctF7F8]